MREMCVQRKERIEKVCEKEGKNWEECERKMEKIERKCVKSYDEKKGGNLKEVCEKEGENFEKV